MTYHISVIFQSLKYMLTNSLVFGTVNFFCHCGKRNVIEEAKAET